jgi:hypothetical protein
MRIDGGSFRFSVKAHKIEGKKEKWEIEKSFG